MLNIYDRYLQRSLTMSSTSNEIVLAQATGPINELFKRLSGKDAQKELCAFKRFLRKQNPWPDAESLIHGRFCSLKAKAALVREWPNVDEKVLGDALHSAHAEGLVSCYEKEVEKNPYLDLVICIHLSTPAETARYATQRLLWPGEDLNRYLYRDLTNDRVMWQDKARPFVPNCIFVEMVDLGANVINTNTPSTPSEIMANITEPLAGFSVLYAASQNPSYIDELSRLPYPLMGAMQVKIRGRVVGGSKYLHLTRERYGRVDWIDVDSSHAGNSKRGYNIPIIHECNKNI